MVWRKEYPIKNFLMITNEESDDRDTQGEEEKNPYVILISERQINCEKTIHAYPTTPIKLPPTKPHSFMRSCIEYI